MLLGGQEHDLGGGSFGSGRHGKYEFENDVYNNNYAKISLR